MIPAQTYLCLAISVHQSAPAPGCPCGRPPAGGGEGAVPGRCSTPSFCAAPNNNICVYIYIYIHMCICVCVYIYIYIYMYVCT